MTVPTGKPAGARTIEAAIDRTGWSGLRPGDDLVRSYRASGVWRDEGPLADLEKWRAKNPGSHRGDLPSVRHGPLTSDIPGVR